MNVIFICISIFLHLFCIGMDDFSDEFSVTHKHHSPASSQLLHALDQFEKASDTETKIAHLKLIHDILIKFDPTPGSDINVINKASNRCLLRCALDHGMVGLFELACEKRCVDIDAPFLNWLVKKQSNHLVKKARSAIGDPEVGYDFEESDYSPSTDVRTDTFKPLSSSLEQTTNPLDYTPQRRFLSRSY